MKESPETNEIRVITDRDGYILDDGQVATVIRNDAEAPLRSSDATVDFVWTATPSSSQMSQFGYDETHYLLRVQFRSGGIYEYLGVEPEVYAELLEAKSAGRFLGERIKGKYEYRKVAA